MKKILIILVSLLVLVLIVLFLTTNTKNPDITSHEEIKQEITPSPTSIPSAIINKTENTKIIPDKDLCPQISKEFVTQVTGVAITRVSSINDSFINACDYYLTSDNNSPYIAIIVNKNLNFEKHKQIAQSNSIFVLKTDPSILGNHYIVWADSETRIVNINLFLGENSFLRIDKNVERALDNEGLIKLASAVSEKL